MADFVPSLEIPVDAEQVGDRRGRGAGGGMRSGQGLRGAGRREGEKGFKEGRAEPCIPPSSPPRAGEVARGSRSRLLKINTTEVGKFL